MIKQFGIAVGLVVVIGSAIPAFAQNNKPVRSGTFYEDRAQNSDISTSATLAFAQAPTDKFLNIRNVACDITLNSSQTLGQLSLFIGTGAGLSDTGRSMAIGGVPVRTIVTSNLNITQLNNNNLFIKVGPGRYPSIRVTSVAGATGSQSVNAICVIVGDLSDD